MPDPDNQKYITFAKSSNGVGHAIPTFLILQSKYMLYKWAFYNNLLDEIFFTISDFVYLNNRLVMDWLRHFNKHSKKCQIRLYCLFIIDDYS